MSHGGYVRSSERVLCTVGSHEPGMDAPHLALTYGEVDLLRRLITAHNVALEQRGVDGNRDLERLLGKAVVQPL